MTQSQNQRLADLQQLEVALYAYLQYYDKRAEHIRQEWAGVCREISDAKDGLNCVNDPDEQRGANT